jgi:16S rRNA (uracil1498-N3)-methyltransferase
MKHFLLPEQASGSTSLTLDERDSHYLLHVLRKQQGDSLQALDTDQWICRITLENNTSPLQIHIDRLEQLQTKTQGIILLQGLPRGKKWDQILRQSVEIGVHSIFPLLSENSQIRIEEKEYIQKKQRWEKIIREAAQQSGTLFPPQLHEPSKLKFALKALPQDSRKAIVFHEKPLEDRKLYDMLRDQPQWVIVAVGPEGGFSPIEIDLFKQEGFVPYRFNTGVLRAETAAIFGLAAVSTMITEISSGELQ